MFITLLECEVHEDKDHSSSFFFIIYLFGFWHHSISTTYLSPWQVEELDKYLLNTEKWWCAKLEKESLTLNLLGASSRVLYFSHPLNIPFSCYISLRTYTSRCIW